MSAWARARSTTSTNLSATDYAAATAVSAWRRRSYHRPPVGRWPRHLQGQVFPGAGAAITAPPGAAPPPAALARRDLAVVVQRIRPARRADPDGPPAGRTDKGAMGGLWDGAGCRRA